MRMRLITTTCLFLATLLVANARAQQTDAWFARQIWTGDSQPINDAVMVTTDGKITAIGPRGSVKVPANARRHDLGNNVIIPGLVVAQTNLVGAVDVNKTLTPEIKAVDGFDFLADRQSMLAAGVTTVQISPGNNRLLPGIGAVVKLAGKDLQDRVLAERESLRIMLDSSTRNPPSIYEPPVGPVSVDRPLEPTRPQLSRTLPAALSGLRSVLGNALNGTADDQVAREIARHFDTQGILRITATTPAEIRGAVSLVNELTWPAIIADCTGLDSATGLDDWKQNIKGVVLPGRVPGSISNPGVDQVEKQREPWQHLRAFIDAGLPVAIRPARDADLKDLMFVAGQFLQANVSREEVMQMVTSWPAKMLGVSDHVGTLAKGKDADFVVLSDDPFGLRSAVVATYVNGENVFENDAGSATTLVRASRIYTGDGTVVSDGSVVVKGHTIRGIGENVSAPLNASVKDFGDAVIVPGYVDLGTGIGIGGPLTGNITVQTKLGEALYSDDQSVALARKHGITTVLLGSLGSAGPTPLVAFKLGDDVRVVSDPVAIRFQIGTSPAASVASLNRTLDRAKAYVDSWKKYESDLKAYEKAKADAERKAKEKAAADRAARIRAARAKAIRDAAARRRGVTSGKDGEKKEPKKKEPAPEKDKPEEKKDKPGDKEGDKKKPEDEKKKDGDKKESDKKAPAKSKADSDKKDDSKKESGPTEPKKPRVNAGLEPFRALFDGKIPAFVEARRGDAIQAAVDVFCKKYKLRMVLVGADDLPRLPDVLDGHDVSVCAGPGLFVEIDDQPFNLPQFLSNEQIPFGFHSKGTTGVGQLPGVIQYAVAKGLGSGDALRGLTSGAADLLSDQYGFGRLASGKDADLVVLSGPPFEHSSRILAVMIDGSWVYEREGDK